MFSYIQNISFKYSNNIINLKRITKCFTDHVNILIM